MTKYNLRPKKEHPALYRTAIKREVLDAIYEQILRKMIVEKCYLDATYTAQRLAEELHTNTRYISAAVSLRCQMNYPSLIAGYRIREAVGIMTDKRNMNMSMQDIALASGFANRQSFYTTFYKTYGTTPRQYKTEFFAKHTSPSKPKDKKTYLPHES